MERLSAMDVYKHTTLSDCINAHAIYNELAQTEKEMLPITGTIYKAGVIAGKRQERARHKGGFRVEGVDALKQLYYQYFINYIGGELEVMPEAQTAAKELNAFLEKHIMGEEFSEVFPRIISHEIEELITALAAANEMQGWIYGYVFAMQMFAACRVEGGVCNE